MVATKQEVTSTVICNEDGKSTHCEITLRENGKVANCTLDMEETPLKIAMNCSGDPEIMRQYRLR